MEGKGADTGVDNTYDGEAPPAYPGPPTAGYPYPGHDSSAQGPPPTQGLEPAYPSTTYPPQAASYSANDTSTGKNQTQATGGYPQQAAAYPQQTGAFPQTGVYPQTAAYPNQVYPAGTVVVSQPVMTVYRGRSHPFFSPNPCTGQCPYCQQIVTSNISYETGILPWAIFGGLCLMGCWLGCSCIPFCLKDLKDVEHRCPNCDRMIYRYQRLN